MIKPVFKYTFLLFFSLLLFAAGAEAQCSICTKTASQLGEKPAAALNTAIIYLMGAPFAIVGFIAWRWWRSNKQQDQ
jgi:hypothetical protein